MAHLITEPSFESNPDPDRREEVSEPFITVAVDLVPVRPGGANGGHKIFTLELLRRLQQRPDLHFVFLTASDSHPEIRSLASADDLLICVHDIEGSPFATDQWCPSPEYHLPAANEELCRQIGADVLYAPFGDSRFAVSGLPYVTMVADLLHADKGLWRIGGANDQITTAQILQVGRDLNRLQQPQRCAACPNGRADLRMG